MSTWLYEWRDNAGTPDFVDLGEFDFDEDLTVEAVDLEALISR